MAELVREYGELGWQTGEPTGGGGGSQDLAQVLAQGGDPDGNSITGPLVIDLQAFADPSPRVVDIIGMPGQSSNTLNITSGDGATGYMAAFSSWDGQNFSVRQDGVYWQDADGNDVFEVGPTGAVTISPSDTDAPLMRVISPADFADDNGNFVLFETPEDGVICQIDAYSDITLYGATGQGQSALFLQSRDDVNYRSQIGSGYPGGAVIGVLAPDSMDVPHNTFQLYCLGYFDMREQETDPAAPDANKGAVFMRDDGSGNTQLCTRYSTGGVNVVLTNEAGVVKVTGLPTADPHVVGQFWNSTGTVKVSAG